MFGTLGTPEIVIIGVVIILIFGVGKISGLGRDLGSSIKEFRRAVKEEDGAEEDGEQPAPAVAQQAAVQPPAAAAPPTAQAPAPPAATEAPPAQQSDSGQKTNIF